MLPSFKPRAPDASGSDASDGDSCPDCGHPMSGNEPAPGMNRERVASGLGPIFAECAVVVHDYGFGDTEDCECTNLVHAVEIRKPWSLRALLTRPGTD